MGCSNGVVTSANQFALVSYIPDPLGNFLDRLRLDLVPGCSPHAHVTVLPPRPICADERQAAGRTNGAQRRTFPASTWNSETWRYSPFRKSFILASPAGNVNCVRCTGSQQRCGGFPRAIPISSGTLHWRRTFPIEELDVSQPKLPLAAGTSITRPAPFSVNSLDFVKNLQGTCWTDLANIHLRAVPVG